MAECTACESVVVFSVPTRGNGKCSSCYGTGKEQGLGGLVSDIAGTSHADCAACGGTGRCQSCGGTGES